MYDLYLLRHGRSLADDENRFEGRYDSPLTRTGEQQARSVSSYFEQKAVRFDCIISSPLLRARRTAEIVNESQRTEIISEPLLIERDNGFLAGKSKEDGSNRFPLPDFQSPFRFAPENSGENEVSLHSRAGYALSKIMEREASRILVVSHGGLLNALVRNMLGIGYPVHEGGCYFVFGDTGLMHIKYDETRHRWAVCSFDPHVRGTIGETNELIL